MKRWVVLVGTLCLLLSMGVLGVAAEEGDTGSITGRVVSRTGEGGPITDQEVVLQGVRHGSEATILPVRVARTDSEGAFRFDGLPVSEDTSFLVLVTYSSVEYESRDVTLTDEVSSVELEMEVFEPTTSDEALRVTLDHMVLEADAQKQVVSVLEVFQVLNGGDRVYVNDGQDPGGQPTFRLSFPEGATQVTAINGVASQDLVSTATGVADTNPLVPGEREIALGYEVPYAESDLLLQKTLLYPTDRFAVLVKDDGFTVRSSTLSAAQQTETGEERYLLLTGDSLPDGADIELSLSGLPTASADDGGPAGLSPWLAVALAAAAVGVAVLYPRLRRRGQRALADDKAD